MFCRKDRPIANRIVNHPAHSSIETNELIDVAPASRGLFSASRRKRVHGEGKVVIQISRPAQFEMSAACQFENTLA